MRTSRTDSSKQQEIPQICLRKQGLPVSGTSLRSEHSPSGLYSFGAHSGRLPSSSRGLGCALSRRLADSPSKPTSLATSSGPAFRNAGPGQFCSKRKEIQAGCSSRYPVSRNSPMFGVALCLG